MPQRLAGRVPPLLVELAVGIAIPLIFVALRSSLVPLLGDRAPYAFNFLAVVCAAVLAGWRAGVLALAVGQAATWYLIVEPQWTGIATIPDRVGGLLVSSLAELLTLSIVILYQREVDRASSMQEEQMTVLSEALKEIDHRTKNNYQTVLALVQLQSQRATDPAVKSALKQVANRIIAVSSVTDRLAQRGEDLASVRLGDHLRGLCDQIERGLSREGVTLDWKLADVTAKADKAASISIILNELLTNSLKHAFTDGRTGEIRVESQMTPDGFELIVSDNGLGIDTRSESGSSGLGRKLIETFVRQLDARHDVNSSARGTIHRILIPSLN